MKREALPPVSAFPARRRRESLRRLRRPTGCSQVGPCELRTRRSRPPSSCHGPPIRRVEDRFPAPPMLGGIDLKCSFLSGCQRRQWFARETAGAHLCRGIRLLFPLRDQAPEFHSVALRQASPSSCCVYRRTPLPFWRAARPAARNWISRGPPAPTGETWGTPHGGMPCLIDDEAERGGSRATIATCMVSADELSDTS